MGSIHSTHGFNSFNPFMFKTITDKLPKDADYPARQFNIDVLTRVMDGTLYDHLPYDFHTERNAAQEYVPLRDRRPSVKYALCKTVVNDSVSMLFSEGHFPSFDCEKEEVRDALEAIAKDSKLNRVMLEAALIGSVGSVAIFMRVLNGRVFFEAKNTQFLTPVWKEDAPDTLQSVKEAYKVKGSVLKDSGYTVADDDLAADFWFQRVFDDQAETWFLPLRTDSDSAPSVDTTKTKTHGLGFVPVEWVKNLPGGNGIDGACTFKEAIDTGIEIDYQLSQAGRGLKYSSDPTLLIKEPATDGQGSIVKGGGNALVVSADGDAKLLEINGTAAQAVIDYVRCLREFALESINGTRSNADKLSAAQSGRAMELMNQQLIWLADKLRISYGEGALLSLLKKVVLASSKFPLQVGGEKVAPLDAKAKISLRWPAWYAPTYADKQTQSETLVTLRTGELLSQETAIKSLADAYDIDDPADELRAIKADAPAPVADTPKLAKPSPDSAD